MTYPERAQDNWMPAGRQLALSLLRMGPEHAEDRYELIRLTADDGEPGPLIAMVFHLLGYVDQIALAQFDPAAWRAWLDQEIADAAIQQTKEG